MSMKRALLDCICLRHMAEEARERGDFIEARRLKRRRQRQERKQRKWLKWREQRKAEGKE